MNIYVVLSTRDGKGEIERFDEEKWNVLKARIDKDRILYVTPDISDTKLKEFKFPEIIWDRVFNPIGNNYKKIKVALSYDVESMNSEFEKQLITSEKEIESQIVKIEEIKQKKYEKNLPKLKLHKEAVNQNDSLIPEDMEEHEALITWKNSGFIMPPPHKISDIKNTYNMSWTNFKKHIESL